MRFRERFLWIGLILLCVCLWPINSYADQIEIPDPRPTTLVYAETKAARRWCISDRIPLHQAPREDSPNVGHLEFMEPVFLALGFPDQVGKSPVLTAEHRSKNQDWALVCVPRQGPGFQIASFRGWVLRRYLIDELSAEVDAESGVAKKAIPVISEVDVQNGQFLPLSPTRRLPTAPIVSNEALPKEANADPPKLALYRLLYVFAEMGDQVLVSTLVLADPTMKPRDLQENILGWVPASRIARWNTRECYQWDRDSYFNRQVPGALFLEEGQAIESLKKVTRVDPSGGVLAVMEPPPKIGVDGRVRPLAPGSMRFHLLTDAKSSQRDPDVKHPFRWINSSQNNELLKIGAVITKEGNDANLDIERLQDTADLVATRSAVTEILFVIDNTQSMEIASFSVAEIIPRIWEEVQREGGEVRVALCFYFDATDPNESYELFGFRSVSNQTAVVELRDRLLQAALNPKNDPYADGVEYLLPGLSNSLFKENFDSYSRKIVIIIGDAGDKLRRSDAAKQMLSNIASQLVSGSDLKEFHIIQLKSPSINESYQVFHDQLNVELRNQYLTNTRDLDTKLEANNIRANLDTFFSYTCYPKEIDKKKITKKLGSPNPDGASTDIEYESDPEVVEFVTKNVVGKIRAAREQGAIFRKRFHRLASELEDPGSTDEPTETGLANEALFKAMLKKSGTDELVGLASKLQPYRAVYGWNRSPLPHRDPKFDTHPSQLRRMVLVNEAEVTDVAKALNALEKRYRDGNSINIEEAILEVAKGQIGQQGKFPPSVKNDLDRAKWLYKRLSFHSPIFEQFINGKKLLIDDEELSSLFLKRRLLEDILHDKETGPEFYALTQETFGGLEYNVWKMKTDQNGAEVVLPTRKRAREKLEGGISVRYYYLDYEKEWP